MPRMGVGIGLNSQARRLGGPVKDSLLALYSFAGNVQDASGNGYNGALVNGATITAYGLRLPQSGTHDYMTTGALPLASVRTVQSLVHWSEGFPSSYQILWGNDTFGPINLIYYCGDYRSDGCPIPVPAPMVYTDDIQTSGCDPVAGLRSAAWVTGSVQDVNYVGGVVTNGYKKRIASAAVGRGGVIQIGYSALGGNQLKGTIVGLMAYSKELSPSEVKRNDSYLRGLAKSRGLSVAADLTGGAANVLAALGDSIAAGNAVTTPWPAGMVTTRTYQRWNYGMSGQTAAEILADMPHRLQVGPFSGPASKKVAVVAAGVNDFILDGVSAAVAFSRIQAIVSACVVAGATGMVVVPVLSASGASYDALKNTLYGLLTGVGAFPAGTRVVPSASLPHLFPDGSYANLTYFNADKIHPTQTGTDELAVAVATEVNALG